MALTDPNDPTVGRDTLAEAVGVAVGTYVDRLNEAEYFIDNSLILNKDDQYNFVGDGIRVSVDQDRSEAWRPATRNITNMSPEAVILIKKKAFSTLKGSNDLQWMDKSEMMLLRATKALFAYKTQQIRTYESLTKLETFYERYREVNLLFFAEFLYNAQLLALPEGSKDAGIQDLQSEFTNLYGPEGTWTEQQRLEYQSEMGVIDGGPKSNLTAEEALDFTVGKARRDMREIFKDASSTQPYSGIGGSPIQGSEAVLSDIYAILKRNAFSASSGLTTWIVDPSDTDNFSTGPGTGVIELTLFNSFSTSCQCDSPSPNRTSFSIIDPYGMLTVTENDVELAISEAISGTTNLLASIAGDNNNSNMPMIDGASVASAALEMMGLGSMDDSLDIDYVRDRLRVFYMGKPFINAADGVSIFINGNRKVSDYSASGNSVNSLDLLDDEQNSVDEIILEAERKLYTKGHIDLDTYISIRDHSALTMTCVFSGLVQNTSQSYSNGFHNLTISCADNMEWLNWSRVISQPALQDPQGILEDPVTPYNIKTDASGSPTIGGEAPELLYENKMLIKSGLLSYDSGILAGQIADEGTLMQGQYNLGGSLYGAKVLQAPHGFVYRWKRGIITATAGLQTDSPLFNDWNSWKQYQEAYGVPVGADVFNNIDVANVLSMLIVGQPYNAESFIQQAYEVQGISGTTTSSLSSLDPLFSVLNATRKQNDKFGSFKPYRLITMSTSSLEKLANNSLLKVQTNQKILSLQKRKAEIRGLIYKLTPNSGGTLNSSAIRSPIVQSLFTELQSVNLGIQSQLAKVQIDQASFSNTGQHTFFDVGHSTEFNLFGESQDMANAGNYEASHQLSRAMTFVGAQRRVDSVRMNTDNNLFIVSDQYDSNTDIRSFLFQLRKGGWNNFKGEFVTSYQKCAEAASILGLEFFCNPAGNLELRPPLWNRIPLSVLEEYIVLQKRKNAQILPEFLTTMFTSRVDSIKIDIHAANVQIALLAILLGSFPDARLLPGMTDVGADSFQFFGIGLARSTTGDTVYGTLMTERLGTGSFMGDLWQAATKGANLIDKATESGNLGFSMDMAGGEDSGDILEGDTTTLLGEFSPITQEASSVKILDGLFPITQPKPAAEVAAGSGGAIGTVVPQLGSSGSISIEQVKKMSLVESIRQAFKKLSGRDVLADVASGTKISSSHFASKPSDIASAKDLWDESLKVTLKFNLLSKLEAAVSRRDSLVSTLQRNIAKQEELEEIERILQSGEEDDLAGVYDIIDDKPGTMQWKDKGVEEASDNTLNFLKKSHEMLVQGIDILTGDSNEGSLWDHLIIDDNKHWRGPGSGKRFVIHDDQIISSNFTETVPQYTRVDVYGDAPIIGDTYNKSFDGLAFWAGATDFDLWRQYGYKRGGDVKLNFASNAELQCKPYAVLLLQIQRARINSGTVEVVGNEYYQPGDVVFIPYRGLLYYVTAVSHSFRIGGGFTTRLTLTNGHPVGIYLPSPFDILGQQFVGNPLYETIIAKKGLQGDDGYRALQPDSTLIFPNNAKPITKDNITNLLNFKNNQLRLYNMMLDLSSIMMGDRYVVIRGFVGEGGDSESKVRGRMEVVRDLLINPVSMVQEGIGIYSVELGGGSEGSFGLSSGLGLNTQTAASLSAAASLGGGSLGQTVETMILPNGSLARAVAPDRIILQLVNLEEKSSVQYDIRCMNREIFNTYELDIGSLNTDNSDDANVQGGVFVQNSTKGANEEGVFEGKPTAWQIPRNKFPVDGPRQATWLHMREALGSNDYSIIGRAIEVGIVDLT